MRGVEPASIEFLTGLLKQCLDEGRAVTVDRLGVFAPSVGRFTFTPDRKPRVFIAYAAEDASVVDRLCDRLEAEGFDAWLDRRNLLPGENWPQTILGAIQAADFFIACLTSRSVAKRGTFQTELRHALDCAAGLPIDDLFFLPVRLDNCRVPARIAGELQFVDLFPDFEAGVRRVIKSIGREWARRNGGGGA
ncbi:MAG TPA: toll/interleukin-1 receptor domain-containing protein [Bryobacteraceae bacterium]|nr:toll/interleukin-1 receptor domain-containing protein [Bryobacteraceae bacterium]